MRESDPVTITCRAPAVNHVRVQPPLPSRPPQHRQQHYHLHHLLQPHPSILVRPPSSPSPREPSRCRPSDLSRLPLPGRRPRHSRIAMALLNPLQLLVFPFLLVVSLPLAMFAGATTILAFVVLFMRLFFVYFDVGLETLRYVLLGHQQGQQRLVSPAGSRRPSAPTSPRLSRSASPREASPPSQWRRRSRAGSVANITPLMGSLGGVSIAPKSSLDRDFEGVGGWRNNADPADEHAWESLNSRLEIPDQRHHHRSQSTTAALLGVKVSAPGLCKSPSVIAISPPDLRKGSASSPNSSRSRTPTRRMEGFTTLERDDYFASYAVPTMRKLVV